MSSRIDVQVPPGDGLVNRFVVLWINASTQVALITKAAKVGDQHRIWFTVLSGKDKGQDFNATYHGTNAATFGTEDEAVEFMKGLKS